MATSSKFFTRASGACSGIGVRACGMVRMVFFLAMAVLSFQCAWPSPPRMRQLSFQASSAAFSVGR